MNTSSNLFVSAAKSYKTHLAIALLTLASFAPLANAIPSNRERYDCYRKSEKQSSFGSPNDVSSSTTLCTLNPNYRSATSKQSRRTSNTGKPRTSTTRNRSRRAYSNVYRNRNSTGATVATGLGNFIFGAFVGSAIWPWDRGWGGSGGWGSWGGWGETFIDGSTNMDIGDIGDLDLSGDDFSGDDFSGDDFSGDDFSGDNFEDDFGGNDMGDEFGDDFGGNDMGDDFGDDFGGDDFGGDDFGDDFGGDDFGDDDFGDF